MSRLEAVNQYENALKQGKKYYNACISRNEDPYPAVLDELVNMSSVGAVNIGLVEVPIERIIGTYTGGRKAAFAGNFMPLMETKPNSETNGSTCVLPIWTRAASPTPSSATNIWGISTSRKAISGSVF
ncbi:MAG: hypothetical protein IJI07_03095 [Flexilinea sp.]|nr:hypothetical protein [Flexilinea sp.]